MRAVCAVVGIGPGNGAALARRFDRAGYAVALLSRSTELSEKLAKDLTDARAYACDIGEAGAVTATFARIKAEMGPVAVLVYNAGSGTWGTVEEISPEAFEAAWRVNALGLLLASQAVIPDMKAKGAGSIIVIGATASRRGVQDVVCRLRRPGGRETIAIGRTTIEVHGTRLVWKFRDR